MYIPEFIFILIQFKEDEFSLWANTGEGWENDSLFFSHFIHSVIEFIMHIYYKKLNQAHSKRLVYVFLYVFTRIFMYMCIPVRI
jgi:hypothetical protein